MDRVYVDVPDRRRRGGLALVAGGVSLAAAVIALAAGAPKPLVCLLVCAPFVVVFTTRPTLRRLAVRNALRRPAESALVLLGALLGTAIITGGFVVQDSLLASVQQRAYTQLGPVDEIVRTTSPAAPALASALAADPPAGIAGTLPITTLAAPVVAAGAVPAAEPHAQVIEVDFAAGQRFGGVTSHSGLAGPTPGPGEAVLGADLAKTLSARVGDSVTVRAYGQNPTFRVTGILPRVGVAGLWLGSGSTSPNIFVAPGTVEALYAGAAAGQAAQTPPVALTAVSNGGSVLQTRARSEQVASELRTAVAGQPASVATAKSDLLDAATRAAQASTSLLNVAADLTVLAGILLLVNTFVMLAQERKVTLGMLRAIGLRRCGLISAFALEGWIYAVVSSALGVIVGAGLGRLVILSSSTMFAAHSNGTASKVSFSATSASLQRGMTAGLVVAVVTAVGTAVWAGRMNVIRAVRDLPEPIRRTSGVRWMSAAVGATAGGMAMIALGAVAGNGMLLLAGPALAAAGAFRLFSRVAPARWSATLLSLAVIVWGVVASSVTRAAFKNASTTLYLLQAVVLAGAAVALFGVHQAGLARALRRSGGKRGLAARLGLAYPLARKARTSLVLAIYVLEIMVLAVALGVGNVPPGQAARTAAQQASGASVRVASDSSNPLSAATVAGLPGVTAVTPAATAAAHVAAGGPDAPVAGSMQLAASSQPLYGHGAPRLGSRAAAYASDEAAWAAVQSDPSVIIVNPKFAEQLPHRLAAPMVGQHLSLRGPATGATRDVTIIGIAVDTPIDAHILSFVAGPLMSQLNGSALTDNLLFVATAPGVNSDRTAALINGQFSANGADAVSFHDLANQALATRQQLFQLVGGFVGVGVVIGVIALGVVMFRAVRERRRDIGTLRALGWTRRGVRQAFLAEAGFVAIQGTVIGLVIGTVFAWRLPQGTSLRGFAVPWPALLLTGAAALVGSLIAAARPADQASRIPPAVALRTAE